MTSIDQTKENELRRKLLKLGYRLEKNKEGFFQIVDEYNWTELVPNFTMTIPDVERFLNETYLPPRG